MIDPGNNRQIRCPMIGSTSLCRSIAPSYAPKDTHNVGSFSEPQVPTCQDLEESMFLNQPEDAAGGLNDHLHSFREPQTSTFITPSKNNVSIQCKKGKASPSISEEWEKLIIIDDLDDDFASPAHPRPAVDKPPRPKPPSPAVKPLDEKTSRILERLEAPRAKKQRANTSKASTGVAPAPASKQIKKPLLPREPSASQPLRPSFNRLRRKLPA